MMRVLASFFVLACLAFLGEASNLQCSYPPVKMTKKWIDMRSQCVEAMIDQIQNEMTAAVQFLAMSAYFGRDTVNRPGFSEFFFSYSCEERDHGIALAEYLVQRGQFASGVDTLFRNSYPPEKTEWKTVVEALNDAIVLEGKMTHSIRKVIEVCESTHGYEDYALDDWLTAYFLKSQYHDQFELANWISSIEKMMKSHAGLGEYLVDIDVWSSPRLAPVEDDVMVGDEDEE